MTPFAYRASGDAAIAALGLGPRHDTVGGKFEVAMLGERGRSGKIDAATWTGCNGQMCGRQCGPGRSVRLWVPCRFAVSGGHSCHLNDEEIEALRRVMGLVT